ncbi:hypothetical protein MA16_Dca009836 [Dendrobium catenatum]|uniref:Uncharacterized protein n=1 Tax=Dendrobium catenatum TaxID=906689 RepID=A0A2I0XIE5_9ASPA|nr:hypothetical protein MA16_Dca009836 [Dendrobium catenatum]
MATVKLTSGCSDTSDLKAKKVLQSRDSEAAPIVHIHHLIQVLVFYLHTMRWNVSTEIYEPEAWKVEDNLYTILKQKLSRVYAAPPSERMKRIYNTSPSKYQTIDQVCIPVEKVAHKVQMVF